MSWMKFDRSKRGLLAADVARFRDDFFDPHMISFRPGSGGEGDGRPLLLYEAEIEPGRLVIDGTVDCSVRLRLTNSESNQRAPAEADAFRSRGWMAVRRG
jgi:hypothetical protein